MGKPKPIWKEDIRNPNKRTVQDVESKFWSLGRVHHCEHEIIFSLNKIHHLAKKKKDSAYSLLFDEAKIR